jgi:succinoglycan biosynthesis transport protein ExoP
MITQIQDQINVLRSRLERGLAQSTVVLVTSAEKNDGKSLVAFSLAESFGNAGYRSIVLDANPARAQVRCGNAIGNVAADRVDVRGYTVQNEHQGYSELILVDPSHANLLSYPQVKAVVAQCRQYYEYVIVDCGEFGGSNLPGLLAKCADGVLVSLRQGRRPTASDEQLALIIEESGAPVLGVVIVPKSAMEAFSARRDIREFLNEPLGHLDAVTSGAVT